MKLARISSLLVVFLVAATAFAQARRVDERIRLRNWTPSAEQMRAFTTAVTSTPLHFTTVTPCRIVDTRGPVGEYGGPAMASGETRSFDLKNGPCSGIPANVAAYSLNFTVAAPTAQGNLTAWPTGQTKPGVSILNYRAGINLANGAIVGAGTAGSIDVAVTAQTHVVIDINGFFIPSADASTVRVTPANLGVWHLFSDLCNTVTIDFTNGEAVTPPLGTGSFQITGTDGDGGALATEAYNGLTVSQLSTLRYSGKSQDATDHPYIYINLDNDGSGSPGTVYFFPANNSAQGPSRANVWQSWNGLTGKWNVGGDTGPAAAVPFSTFAASHILGVRFASGCGGTTGGVPRVRNTDDVEIGVDGNAPTVFDFERN